MTGESERKRGGEERKGARELISGFNVCSQPRVAGLPPSPVWRGEVFYSSLENQPCFLNPLEITDTHTHGEI